MGFGITNSCKLMFTSLFYTLLPPPSWWSQNSCWKHHCGQLTFSRCRRTRSVQPYPVLMEVTTLVGSWWIP